MSLDNYNYSPAMFYGTTIGVLPSPFFWDPHTPLLNGSPPGTVIVGKPGSGKTFLSSTIAGISAMLGKMTVIFDPKGDFIQLVNIQEDIGPVKIWPLAKGREGMLDPFLLVSDKKEQLGLALTVIEIFCDGLDGSELSVLSPVLKDVIKYGDPTLLKVVDILRSSEKDIARQLGAKLDLIRQQPLGHLCFATEDTPKNNLDLDRGTTIISLLGFDLDSMKENTIKGRLVSGVLHIVLDYTKRLLLKNEQDKSLKTLIVDEAWAFAMHEKTANFLNSFILLGRSFGLATILSTQAMSHLETLNIEETTSTIFSFGSGGLTAAKDVVKKMMLPEDEGFAELIVSLERGECLVKDWGNKTNKSRYSTVYISDWNSKWNKAFDTTPKITRLNTPQTK